MEAFEEMYEPMLSFVMRFKMMIEVEKQKRLKEVEKFEENNVWKTKIEKDINRGTNKVVKFTKISIQTQLFHIKRTPKNALDPMMAIWEISSINSKIKLIKKTLYQMDC